MTPLAHWPAGGGASLAMAVARPQHHTQESFAHREEYMRIRSCTIITLAAVATLSCVRAASAGAQDNDPTLQGAWAAESYILNEGHTHRVSGRIFFTRTEWTVLFFVLDANGEPRRGSGEGGTYTLRGNELVFSHLFNFSAGAELPGLPAASMQMISRSASEAQTEPSTIRVVGEQLTIFFPSGNRMMFTRSSR